METSKTFAHQLNLTWYFHAKILTQVLDTVFISLQCSFKSYVQKLSMEPTASYLFGCLNGNDI